MDIMPKRRDHKPEINARLGVERNRKRKKPLDRLTRDAIAAEQAGMSYGKYKALHPHTPDEGEEDQEPPRPKVDPDKYERVCETCGKTFYLTTKVRQKYCSDYCRTFARSQREQKLREKKKQESEDA